MSFKSYKDIKFIEKNEKKNIGIVKGYKIIKKLPKSEKEEKLASFLEKAAADGEGPGILIGDLYLKDKTKEVFEGYSLTDILTDTLKCYTIRKKNKNPSMEKNDGYFLCTFENDGTDEKVLFIDHKIMVRYLEINNKVRRESGYGFGRSVVFEIPRISDLYFPITFRFEFFFEHFSLSKIPSAFLSELTEIVIYGKNSIIQDIDWSEFKNLHTIRIVDGKYIKNAEFYHTNKDLEDEFYEKMKLDELPVSLKAFYSTVLKKNFVLTNPPPLLETIEFEKSEIKIEDIGEHINITPSIKKIAVGGVKIEI